MIPEISNVKLGAEVSDMGLPDQIKYVPYGLSDSYDSQMSTPSITNFFQEALDTVKDWDQAAGDWIRGAVEKDYNLVKGALGTVLDDTIEGTDKAVTGLMNPVDKILGSGVFYVVILVGVLGVALYYTGKSGGLRVNI